MKASLRGWYSRAACTLVFAFLFLAVALPAGAAPQAEPPLPSNLRFVKDINPADRVTMFSGFVQMGDSLYFSGRDDTHGIELWRANLDGSGMALVKDINPGRMMSDPRILTIYNDELYFTARHPVYGLELWKTNGVETVMLKDIYPGEGGQNPTVAFSVASIVTEDVNTFLFFTAMTPGHGNELWKTDGTPGGTVLVKDITLGANGSNPYNLTAFNNAVYFTASDGVHGQELWKTDGTGAGTMMVEDIYPGTVYQSSSPQDLFVMPVAPRSSALVFTAIGDGIGAELFTCDTDGVVRMVMDIYPGFYSSQPSQFQLLGGSVYFVAGDGPAGNQVWKYDGSAVTRVTNINAPVGAGWIRMLATASLPDRAAMKDYLLFAAYDPDHGEELWKTDGTTTTLVKDIRPGTEGSSVDGMVAAQGAVYFRADDGTHGSELWISDGTTSGTMLLKDVLPGSGSGNPRDLSIVKSRFLFYAEPIWYEGAPWISNGTTETTRPIDNTVPGSGSSDESTVGAALDDRLIFPARTASAGVEPWVSDGTAEGTLLLADALPGAQSAHPEGFTRLGDKVLFSAYAPESGRELWITDGTPGGTELLKDLLAGLRGGEPKNLTAVDGMAGGVGPAQTLVFFTTQDASNAFSLWKTDGTAGGTVRVVDSLTYVDSMAAGSGFVFLAASDTAVMGSFNNLELWRSDGTPAGTKRLKDIWAGDESSDVRDMFFHNGMLYFSANDGVTGSELWKSNGTEAGTVLIKDINPPDEFGNRTASSPRYLTALGNKLLFSAQRDGEGEELWITDGTAAGTAMVKDIYPGWESSYPYGFFVMGGIAFFSADDGASGSELWKTDGTPAGTVRVKDINSGPGSSDPNDFASAGGMLYFQAWNDQFGGELWASRGTDATTFLFADFYPGPEGSWAYGFHNLGANLFFYAANPTHSYEPWLLEVPFAFIPVVQR